MEKLEKKLFEEMALERLRDKYRLPHRFLSPFLDAARFGRRKTARTFLEGREYRQTPGPWGTDILVSLRPEDIILPDEGNAFEDPLPQKGRENEVLVLAQHPLVGVLKIFRMGVLVGRAFLGFSPAFRTIKPFDLRGEAKNGGEVEMAFLLAVWPTATPRRHTLVLPGRPARTASQEEIGLAADHPLGPYTLRTHAPMCLECGQLADTAGGFSCWQCQEAGAVGTASKPSKLLTVCCKL